MNMAYLHFIYRKVKERIHGETSHAISIKRCKCVDGWMDSGYGLHLKALVHSLFYHPLIYILFFSDMAIPFLSLVFFGSCFFDMLSFLFILFLGNYNLTMYFILGMF